MTFAAFFVRMIWVLPGLNGRARFNDKLGRGHGVAAINDTDPVVVWHGEEATADHRIS